MWLSRLLVLHLLWSSSAIAADYYFAANGNDEKACTQARPCRSIAKLAALIDSATPGDTFYLRGGDIFRGRRTDCIAAFNVDGTQRNPVTVTTYEKGRAIIENCRYGINGTLTDWWVIDNLEIKNSVSAIRCRGCQDWVVHNNSFHDMDKVCLYSLPSLARPSMPTARWTVRDNVCYETGLKGQGEGYYLIGAKDILVEHNEFFHLRDEGVNCKDSSNSIVVRQNYFHDFFAPGASPSAGSPVPTAGNFSEDTAINCRVVENVGITSERNFIENMPHTGIRMGRTQHAVTRYNLIIQSGAAAIDYTEGAKGDIAYNTIYNNASAYFNEGQIPTTGDISWGNGSGNDATNPQFVNVADGDFNLAANSDRINTGAENLSEGVFHSPTLQTCNVVGVDASTVRCEVGPIRFSPLRCPAPRAFTVKVNGHSMTTTTCTVVADTMVDIGFLGNGIQESDTITLSASYGALQDSAWIGGMTSGGECLAVSSVCNGALLAISNKAVSHGVMTGNH